MLCLGNIYTLINVNCKLLRQGTSFTKFIWRGITRVLFYHEESRRF